VGREIGGRDQSRLRLDFRRPSVGRRRRGLRRRRFANGTFQLPVRLLVAGVFCILAAFTALTIGRRKPVAQAVRRRRHIAFSSVFRTFPQERDRMKGTSHEDHH
jgi:hypothetical protein